MGRKISGAVFTQVIPRWLRDMADTLEQGGTPCNMSEDEVLQVFEDLNNAPISKEQAYGALHISRSTFEERVRTGVYPEGLHDRGHRRTYWYKNDFKRINKDRRRSL